MSLVYCDLFAINPALGSMGYYKFRTNSLWDPNYTGSGHQPYGFDTLATLYNRYLVTGAKITVNAYANDALAGFGIGVKVTDDANYSTSDPIAVQEQPGYRYKLYGNGKQPPIPSVTQTWSLRKMVGRAHVHDEKYSALCDANPTDPWYFNVAVFPLDGTVDLPAVTINVRITYRAKFFEPRELAQS